MDALGWIVLAIVIVVVVLLLAWLLTRRRTQHRRTEAAHLRAQVAELTELQKKAENDAFHKRKEQFLVADKAGDQAALKKMIAELASGSVPTN